MFLRFKSIILLVLFILTSVFAVAAQQTSEKKDEKKSDLITGNSKDTPANLSAEQVAENSVAIYSFLGGRDRLNQIRKTTIEHGRVSVVKEDGTTEKGPYERRILRAPTLDKDKIRLDQDFPSARYSLVYDGDKIFGIFKDTVFIPREDAASSFENQMYHGLEALLRYKENESKVELAKRDKIMGVDFYVLDVTDKQDRKTRFFVSAKSWRVMMLEYVNGALKYMRKFYDYNYAQGTLVPFRTVLMTGDKIVEETDVQTVTFGQKVEEELFVPAS